MAPPGATASSERPLEMLERDQAPGAVHGHPDRVEADHLRIGPVTPLHQPAPGHLAHPRLLVAPTRLKRPAGPAAGSTGFDLTERQGRTRPRDDVQLAPARPVV